jgi:hypothetical protein
MGKGFYSSGSCVQSHCSVSMRREDALPQLETIKIVLPDDLDS